VFHSSRYNFYAHGNPNGNEKQVPMVYQLKNKRLKPIETPMRVKAGVGVSVSVFCTGLRLIVGRSAAL